MTQINIAQVAAASGTVADIKIGQIVLGGLTIGQVTLTGTSVDIASASASLTNVRAVISLDFQLDWWVNFGPFGSDSGSANLGSISFAANLGNLSIPSLNHIDLSIPTLVVTNLGATVPPIASLDLGGGSFTGLVVSNLGLPPSGFTLSGLGLGAASVASVQAPGGTAASMTLQDFHPNASVVIPSVTLGPVKIPSANSSGDITNTSPISTQVLPSPQGLQFSLGVVGGGITVTPTVTVSIGTLQLTGVALSASVTQAVLQNIGVPVDIKQINLNAIDIGQITATNITF